MDIQIKNTSGADQSYPISENLENKKQDKLLLIGSGVKYLIASFLNEKTGGKFSFLRNCEANSAKRLLQHANDALSADISKVLKEKIDSLMPELNNLQMSYNYYH